MSQKETVTLIDLLCYLEPGGQRTKAQIIKHFRQDGWSGVSRESIGLLIGVGVSEGSINEIVPEASAEDQTRTYECSALGLEQFNRFCETVSIVPDDDLDSTLSNALDALLINPPERLMVDEPKAEDQHFALPPSPVWPSKEHPLFGRLVELRNGNPLFPKSLFAGDPRILGWTLPGAEQKLAEWTVACEDAAKKASESENSVASVDLPKQSEAEKKKPTGANPRGVGVTQQDLQQVVASLDQRLKLAQKSASDADGRALKLEQRAVNAERELQDLRLKFAGAEVGITELEDLLKQAAEAQVPTLLVIEQAVPESNVLDGVSALEDLKTSAPPPIFERAMEPRKSALLDREIEELGQLREGGTVRPRPLVPKPALLALVVILLISFGAWFATRDTGSSAQDDQQLQVYDEADILRQLQERNQYIDLKTKL